MFILQYFNFFILKEAVVNFVAKYLSKSKYNKIQKVELNPEMIKYFSTLLQTSPPLKNIILFVHKLFAEYNSRGRLVNKYQTFSNKELKLILEKTDLTCETKFLFIK
ncbi:hypothetical protein BpHYR1_036325 [Brachionus plicatilis]|uniref:Uncharacterized protein n=1 Tax=Brachionus plicatilis TaxID=10195 RepID=A0A3M7PW77_BRAPC|nr:hypothetical protein BpHYR1_036325 [Brachionus plicatilis]